MDFSARDNLRLKHMLQQFCTQEALPQSFYHTAQNYFLPLAAAIAQQQALLQKPLLVGLNGCQGSGKSTLGALLVSLLPRAFGLRTVVISIDDFYFTRAERQQLAERVHPLLATRGVPGTHDVALMAKTLTDLLSGLGDIMIPRFDKAQDDRTDVARWHRFGAPGDVVILEGWCVGVRPQAESALLAPVNTLEAEDDADGRWRHYVNAVLASDYAPVFKQLDLLLMLRAPSFDCVHQWRVEQEWRLAQRLGAKTGDHRLMSAAAIARFIQHYQRLTEHALATLGPVSDLVLQLNTTREVTAMTGPMSETQS